MLVSMDGSYERRVETCKGAPVNISDKPKGHGSHIRMLLGVLLESLYRALCPWPYHP